VPDVFNAYSFYIDGTGRHAGTDLLDDLRREFEIGRIEAVDLLLGVRQPLAMFSVPLIRPSRSGLGVQDMGHLGERIPEIFDEYCARNDIRRSLGSTGICYDNGVSESFFASY
jgi:transposase InsO family protein